jgi:diguanylate cyclase (GGDEF)-like protein
MNALAGIATQETRVRSRIQRFLWLAGAYGVCLIVMTIAFAAQLLGGWGIVTIALAVIAANGAFFYLLQDARSERYRDPDLVWPQTLAAIAIFAVAAYHLDYDRGVVLVASYGILTIGLFRFSTREFLTTAALIFGAYALTGGALFLFKPAMADVQRHAFHLLILALTLPPFALFCARMSEARRRVRPAYDELSTAVATIEQLANHDRLTRLANRGMFADTLSNAIARAESQQREIAVLLIDLDRFKNVNDTLGHGVGDTILQETARRLLATMRQGDFIARLGGDEFAILVENYRGATELADMASRLLATFKPTYGAGGRGLAITASVGVCTYPQGATDCETMLSNADIALYRAKEQGRNRFCMYTADLNRLSQERLVLEAQLLRAIEGDELEVWFQPKVSIKNGRVKGVEALVRWRHPEHGLLMPGRFIPLAEETGIIESMDLWVLRRVCERSQHWRELGTPLPPVAVNLSANQLARPDLVDALSAILSQTGAVPDMLELEITETAVMRDPERAVAVMESLKGMGMHLAIDDFGMGHSSLGYLKRFPVDSLKIDRTFVKDLPHDRDDVAITRAIIAMAHSLQVSVVAEGVERRDQYDVLRAEGCDQFQGFLCQPALREEDLVRFLDQKGGTRTGIRRRSSLVSPL